MYEIGPDDARLIKEFKTSPYGRHSPNLQYLLNRLRWVPLDQRYILVCRKPKKEWILAKLTGKRGEPPEILEDKVYTSRLDAEMDVLKIRWKAATGEELNS